MADRLVLIGMMGAGKTTVGRLVAAKLGWRYFDSDAQVVAETGRTIRQIFESEGEASFRALESAALREAMSSDDDVVVGAAGGAVLDPDNRALISSAAKVVWLRASVSVLAARASRGDHRPLLGSDPAEAISGLYEERRPLYEELADVIVDVDNSSPESIAEQIVAVVR